MNRNRHEAKARPKTLRIWTYAEAKAAVPYLASVVRSLREHWLEMQHQQAMLRKLEAEPGRPERQAMIAQQEMRRESEQAASRFEDALAELQSLDVYCLDPNRGEALIPFVHGDQLAWFVYDLFEPEPLSTWRYHSDPFDMRRPISEAAGGGKQLIWSM